MFKRSELVELTFYGGVEEIGGNKILVKSPKGSVFLDFGLSYQRESKFFEEFLQPRTNSKFHELIKLGILPKINGIYRKDAVCPEGFTQSCTPSPDFWSSPIECYDDACSSGSWRPDAVFVSHAHADHCGYIPYLADIPVYCSETTRKIMKAIAQVGNLDGFDSDLTRFRTRYVNQLGQGAYFPDSYEIKAKDPLDRAFKPLDSGAQQEIVQDLSITGFDVGHSIPGSMCCLIEADDKQVLYTGDLRFHGRTNPDLSALEGLKPDVMISEGTRIDEQVPDDEDDVKDKLAEKIEQAEGLAIVGFSWKDLERYETVKEAADSCGRTAVFDPRVAYLLARLGTDMYGDGAKAFIERTDSMLYSKADYVNDKFKLGPMDLEEWSKKPRKTDTTHYDNGVKAYDLNSDPDKYVLHLDFYRFKNLLDLELPTGSIYVRAQCEPFTPEMVLTQERMINWLRHFKLNEDNGYKPYQIHSSGHASGDELSTFIDSVKPKQLIPVHTLKPGLFVNSFGTVKKPKLETPIQI